MRKIILGVGISLDGYIARPNGAVDFLFMPKGYSMAPFFATIDASIMGRKTFDAALRMGGTFTDSKMPTYVMSRTQLPGKREGLIFTAQSPTELARELRGRRGGKDIWLMGGGELAREFLNADLVDGIYLGVVPVLLGGGIPLFPSGFPQRNFTLVENKTHEQGLIAVKYERVRPRPRRLKPAP
jgi:dihydrofolate reductase